MSETVIKVENISKLYRLGQVGRKTLHDDINRWLYKITGKEDPYLKIGQENDRAKKGDSEYVWALRDINFEMQRGEVLGIIGRNGAGKSTLLKILSRVTAPTSGNVKIKGRIASLLEVGTGFHPDLSGRDNIFLNGAILGMTKKEIRNKFDAIVDFAGVERYIDTPVKRYSSGMYVRLAFAVAAHLEPDILIVDEVLAVGDAEFQKKCLGKMKDASVQDGRTVLFVSHNMTAVKSLCSRAIMLDNGFLRINANVDGAVSSYLKAGSEIANHKIFAKELSLVDIEIHELKIYPAGKQITDAIIEGEEIEFLTRLTVHNNASEKYHITYQMYNETGDVIFSFSHVRDGINLKNGTNELTCRFPGKFFNTGSFYITMLIVRNDTEVILREKDIISFTIIDAAKEPGSWFGKSVGSLKPSFTWVND